MAHTNRLANETSPYLLQHAHNPVDWYPWGEEAFRAARERQVPILLSIGYSACHWCHVMAHESFEDEATAAVMNRLFVNVKVDREERPDLDKVYQLAHQVLTQRGGGWQLLVLCAVHRRVLPPQLRCAHAAPRERALSRQLRRCRARRVPPLPALQAAAALGDSAPRGPGHPGLPHS